MNKWEAEIEDLGKAPQVNLEEMKEKINKATEDMMEKF